MIYRTYIQQLYFDGKSYTKGPIVDLLEKFNIVCTSFPFKRLPEAKELPSRDWSGEDGRDVYIPKTIPMKHYELEAVFLYKGTESTISKDLSDFIEFIYGRNRNAIGGRLLVYDEYVGMGRIDVHVQSVNNEIYDCDDTDIDAIASFKVKFIVENPTTEVTPKYVTSPSGVKTISELNFNV